MKELTGIGLMTGTSMDGLDLAYCRFYIEEEDGYRFDLLEAETVPFDAVWKSRLAYLHEQSAEVYAKTHVYFGHWLGKATQAFILRNKLKPDFVASHGQTIFHQPQKNFTAQIGDGETLVSYLDCPLVSQFRNKDVALGGQGAPLITLGEHYLFPEYKLFLNLGGISNITYGKLAYDVSPCNLVLNYLTRLIDPNLAYDPEGSLARSGNLQTDLLKALNDLPYYKQASPKSLGWEWIAESVLPLLEQHNHTYEDSLHTFVVHIAQQISLAILQSGLKNERILITGGGRHNVFLIEQIQHELLPFNIQIPEDTSHEIIDFKEAIVFAFLGLRVLTGKYSTLASVTGSTYNTLSGSIHLPATGGFCLL